MSGSKYDELPTNKSIAVTTPTIYCKKHYKLQAFHLIWWITIMKRFLYKWHLVCVAFCLHLDIPMVLAIMAVKCKSMPYRLIRRTKMDEIGQWKQQVVSDTHRLTNVSWNQSLVKVYIVIIVANSIINMAVITQLR